MTTRRSGRTTTPRTDRIQCHPRKAERLQLVQIAPHFVSKEGDFLLAGQYKFVLLLTTLKITKYLFIPAVKLKLSFDLIHYSTHVTNSKSWNTHRYPLLDIYPLPPSLHTLKHWSNYSLHFGFLCKLWAVFHFSLAQRCFDVVMNVKSEMN